MGRAGSILISDEWKGYTRELEEAYFPAKVNHSVRYAQWGVVDGVEMSINTNHIEREWREVRKVLAYVPASEYPAKLNKEVFRLLYLAGCPREERAFVFLKTMAELAKQDP